MILLLKNKDILNMLIAHTAANELTLDDLASLYPAFPLELAGKASNIELLNLELGDLLVFGPAGQSPAYAYWMRGDAILLHGYWSIAHQSFNADDSLAFVLDVRSSAPRLKSINATLLRAGPGEKLKRLLRKQIRNYSSVPHFLHDVIGAAMLAIADTEVESQEDMEENVASYLIAISQLVNGPIQYLDHEIDSLEFDDSVISNAISEISDARKFLENHHERFFAELGDNFYQIESVKGPAPGLSPPAIATLIASRSPWLEENFIKFKPVGGDVGIDVLSTPLNLVMLSTLRVRIGETLHGVSGVGFDEARDIVILKLD